MSSDPFAGYTSPSDDDFEGDLAATGSVPPGVYAVRVHDVRKATSKQGNPMYEWDFEVIENQETKSKEFAGQVLRTYYTSLISSAMWKVEEAVVALGLGKPGDKFKFKKADAIGRIALVRVISQPFNGREQMSVESVGMHPAGPVAAGSDAAREATGDIPF